MTNSAARSDRRDPSRWNMTPVPARVAERAFSRREVAASGCWISTYSTASHGYAQIGWQEHGQRHVVLAHRASWVHSNGQVPVGLTLDHTCKTRTCVNPDHLRLLSNYENSRRNTGGDWELGACRNGHPNTDLEESLRTAKSGRKYFGLRCRVCMSESRKRWRERNPEKVNAIREAYKERAREKGRAWYQANKEISKARARASKQRRRAELTR